MTTCRDRYTFQLAELTSTKTSALAFAEIAANFIRSYHDNKLYDTIASTVMTSLLKSAGAFNEEVLKGVEAVLIDQQNALSKKVREKEKRAQGWTPNVCARKHDINSEDEDSVTESEILREDHIAEEQRLMKLKWEWEQNELRNKKIEEEREENLRRLAQKMRQVDSQAFEHKLKSGQAVLVNSSFTTSKKGGKSGGTAPLELSEEEVGKLYRDVVEVMKEKDRLKIVLSIDEDELSNRLKEAQQSLAKLREEANTKGPFMNLKAKAALNKAQITQIRQKISKQTIEKNRLALQLKAMEPSETRKKLLQVLQECDSILVSRELAESA